MLVFPSLSFNLHKFSEKIPYRFICNHFKKDSYRPEIHLTSALSAPRFNIFSISENHLSVWLPKQLVRKELRKPYNYFTKHIYPKTTDIPVNIYIGEGIRWNESFEIPYISHKKIYILCTTINLTLPAFIICNAHIVLN